MTATATKKSSRIQADREYIERLLVAAEDQLREEELEFLTVDRILERANVSVGSFYRRFPSKDVLLHAVLDRMRARMQPALLSALEDEKQIPESLEEAIQHSFGTLIEHVLGERQLSRAFMLLSAFDPVIREKVREFNIERRDAISEVLATHRAEIAHADVDVAIHQAYHMYLSCMQGRLVFFAPNNIPSIGVSDQFIFTELKSAITYFLRGSGSTNTKKQ